MTRLLIIIFLGLSVLQTVNAQTLKGTISDNKGEPLVGANVYWMGTATGTSTDSRGKFEITLRSIADKHLVVSYVGYVPDTIAITNQSAISIQLKETTSLGEVEVKGQRPGTYISVINPIKTQVITQTELTKAACCDLSGCFDTEGSVEPTTTNVVTNSKELRILGLSGIYNQVLIDGFPLIQGLSYTYGVSSIPGTLVDNIYVAKGANSVVQGFESISGQINVELKEPDRTEKLLLNAYMNSFLEKQFNANYAHRWKNWSTIVAAHTTQPSDKFDKDEDNFLDLPLLTRYSFYNKWKYKEDDSLGLSTRIGLRYLNEQRIGGQLAYQPETDKGSNLVYGQTMNMNQPEIYTKTGYRFNNHQNITLFASAYEQNQTSWFGVTRYKANQNSLYANLQYEHKWRGKHYLKTGVSYRYFYLKENISFTHNTLGRTYDGQYLKDERIGGVFAENTFNWMGDKITLITGLRLDNHNTFGWYATPRALLKYQFSENTTARVSGGTGWRTVNIFSENINLLASSRDILIIEQLKPESAFNWGANLTHSTYSDNFTATFGLDFYQTRFTNQIFPDYDTDPTKAIISNFTGTSVSNSLQAEAVLKFYDVIEAKFDYNYLDVYRMVDGIKEVLPFNSKHKVNTAFSYNPRSDKWHFDMNVHWYGRQRLANTSSNPPEYQTPETSKPFTLINAQFTKSWNRLDIYMGAENLFNFRQNQPIVSWQDPFGPYFDTSSVWGPTRGREVYLGLRFKIE